MKARTTARFALCLAVAAVGGCAELGLYAPAPPRMTGQVVAAGNVRNTAVRASITVGEARRLAVANGLTGYRALPPGIARNLARGKPLPPGIARKMVPGDMLAGLPRVDGHEWRITGTDLVLIAIGTLIVVEVLDDVFR
ncbi:MAG TPA: anti-virulence regulator CigR family protein [Pseudomonadales bacterium]